MNRLKLLAMLLLFLPASHARAQLAFDPPTIDLGEVKAGQVFSYQIKVTNTASSAITMQELKSSCGCIQPTLEPSTLAPGASGTLKLDINTLVSNPGPTTYGIKLRYPEAAQLKEQQFIITGRVVQEIVVTPSAITCYGEKPRPQTITILDKRTTPIKPIKLERTSPYLDVEWVKPDTTQTAAQYALKVSVRDDLPAGRHDHEVVVYTTDVTYPVLRIPITIVKKAKARFVMSPYLVIMSKSLAPSKTVTLRDQHGQGVPVERIEASPGIVVTVTNQAAASVTYQVSLEPNLVRDTPFDAEVKVYLQGQKDPVKLLINVE
jgi:Protein of unknown function (DUF1573)